MTTPYEEFSIYKRSPRIVREAVKKKKEIQAPKEKRKLSTGSLLSMLLPPIVMVCVTIAVEMSEKIKILKGIASPREIWTNGEVIIKDVYSKFRGVLKDTANNTVAWVGSAVVNGCDNYDEYACGEIDGWRAISEWGAETLADVGKVVLAVGVSTVVCATVAAAAPVIAAAATSTLAVGATAVVLCATADFFVSKFTDKGDVGELVSDKVLDLINQGADLFYDKVIARGE